MENLETLELHGYVVVYDYIYVLKSFQRFCFVYLCVKKMGLQKDFYMDLRVCSDEIDPQLVPGRERFWSDWGI